MFESPPADELPLRATERQVILAPPDLAAFSGVDAALLAEQRAGHDDTTSLAELVAAGVRAARTRVLGQPAQPIFVSERTTPIPAIELAPAPVPTQDFSLGGPIHGHYAWLPPRTGPRARASALVLAISIPLCLPDVAAAQNPASKPAPAASKPAPAASKPAPASTAPASPATASTAPPVRGPTATPAEVPSPPPPAPVVESPPQPAPAATPAPSVPPPGAARPAGPPLQTILEAMKGHEAVLYLRTTSITGRIVGVDGDFVAIVDFNRSGRIALVPKSEIVEVRGRVKGAPPADMPDGTPALAGGGVLIALGSPLMLSGLVFIGIIPSSPAIYLPQVLPAAILLGAGIPLVMKGSRQRREYNSALAGAVARGQLTPNFAPIRGGGWTGGLTLRF